MSYRKRQAEQNTREKSEQSKSEAKEKQNTGKKRQTKQEEADRRRKPRKTGPSEVHVADESHCFEFCTFVHCDRSGGGRSRIRMAVAVASATLVLAELQGRTSIWHMTTEEHLDWNPTCR